MTLNSGMTDVAPGEGRSRRISSRRARSCFVCGHEFSHEVYDDEVASHVEKCLLRSNILSDAPAAPSHGVKGEKKSGKKIAAAAAGAGTASVVEPRTPDPIPIVVPRTVCRHPTSYPVPRHSVVEATATNGTSHYWGNVQEDWKESDSEVRVVLMADGSLRSVQASSLTVVYGLPATRSLLDVIIAFFEALIASHDIPQYAVSTDAEVSRTSTGLVPLLWQPCEPLSQTPAAVRRFVAGFRAH
jgi:hypothetical protein